MLFIVFQIITFRSSPVVLPFHSCILISVYVWILIYVYMRISSRKMVYLLLASTVLCKPTSPLRQMHIVLCYWLFFSTFSLLSALGNHSLHLPSSSAWTSPLSCYLLVYILKHSCSPSLDPFPNHSRLLICNICYPFRELYNSHSSWSVLILHTPPSGWCLVLIKLCLVEEQRMAACVNAAWLPQLFTEVALSVSFFYESLFIYIFPKVLSSILSGIICTIFTCASIQ